MALGIKNERKILDSGIVLVAFICAFVAGFLQNLELGAITITLILPPIFLIGLAFLHLVTRKGRKFDKREHQLSYELLKTVVFGGFTYSAYMTGLSTTRQTFMPQNLSMAAISVIFVVSALYLMAYRANIN